MTRNLNLKLFSIVIALLLTWFVHSESNTTVRTFVAAIELKHVPTGRMVLTPLNPSAQVTVRGPSFIVSKIPSSPPVFTVAFPDNAEKLFKAQLDPNALPLPPHVEVLNVDPPEIDFTLDSLVQRQLPVVVPRIGMVDEALRVIAVSAVPDKIEGLGPATELNGVASVETEPIDLRNLTESANLTLQIRNTRQLTRLSTDKVAVHVEIGPVVADRKFDQIPLEVRAAPGARVAVEPDAVAVELTGPKAQISALKRSEVVAFVLVADSGEDATVGVDAPPGIDVVLIDPQKVKVVQLPEPKKAKAVRKGGP